MISINRHKILHLCTLIVSAEEFIDQNCSQHLSVEQYVDSVTVLCPAIKLFLCVLAVQAFLFQFSSVKNTMRENVALLLILFPVCAHLLDFTYYTDSYKRNWASAQAFCRKHRTDLVQIRNAKESEVFQGYGWIGLYREDASSPWKWSRGGEIAIFTM